MKNLNSYSLTEEVWMVPCVLTPEGNRFNPISTPLDKDTELYQRQSWSPGEDEQLREIAQRKGAKGWMCIASEVNQTTHSGLPIRNGKQCRERYYNSIDPSISHEEWTLEEDILLLELQQAFGNKWSRIAQMLKGRPLNHIKNRYKTLRKKESKLKKKAIVMKRKSCLEYLKKHTG